jgi:hypothetical protein
MISSMNIFTAIIPKNLYQSYVIHTEDEGAPFALRTFLEDEGHIVAHSSDVLSQVYDSFTIADSAFVKEWASNKGVTEGLRICIISAKFINREAEHALLKLLEEPGENMHFFIILPPSTILLDTILSRVHVIHLDQEKSTRSSSSHEKFLKLKSEDRIIYIAELIKKHEKDETSGGLRHEALNLINYIEKIVHEKLKVDYKTGNTEMRFGFQELQNAREYLSTPGASVKMILEHIALVVQ